ncbi:MAG: hybrid sensor histidine kinase/response regulator [Chloroflexi bacterium]|nr:hybrid sensor histidine kinase/response regulator [Chloroflexota bacterium]
MLDPVQAMVHPRDGSFTNLQDLRKDILIGFSWLLIVAGLVAGAAAAQVQVFPNAPMLQAYMCALFALIAWLQRNRHTTLACHILVWGSGFVLSVSMAVIPDVWLPVLSLPLVLVAATLVTGSEWIVAAANATLAYWLTANGYRNYELPMLLGALALTLGCTVIAVRALRNTLIAAWEMEQQTDALLIEARERQGAQANTLKSFELATYLLEQANHRSFIAERQAEEAQRMKEQFAANISHELRTPLNLILGFSQMMYLSPQVYGPMQWPTTLRRDIYQIYHSSRHLLEMIDDILDLSRFELVGFTLNKEPTDLKALLESAAEIAAGLFRDRPVRLETVVAPDLPALEIDRTRVRQVILNLLTNARNATEAGFVRISAQRAGGEVVVSVSDTGPGIAADKLSRIFESFYQIDSSIRRDNHGTGLGLAISKHFVEAHGGRIWVESQKGAGSTFYFSLPIPGIGTPTLYPKGTQSLDPAWRDNRPRIVVIDPEPSVATMVQRHIEGFEVVHVENRSHLADSLALHQPLAIVQNVAPAEADEACAHLPDEFGALPVIRCSLPSKAWLADDLMVTASLIKPVTSEQLFHEIRRVGQVRDVLVVDDDRGFGQLMERMLSVYWAEDTNEAEEIIQVRHAYDGEQGLRAMRERRPDLLLLDLVMPNVDGFQLLAQKRSDPVLAGVPVILLTVTNAAEDALLCKGSRLAVDRTGGLRLAEVLRCLSAVVHALEPRGSTTSNKAKLS